MANRQYAEISDLWKHLPLAEILSLEQPHLYCDHAGSAQYKPDSCLGKRLWGFPVLCRSQKGPQLLQLSQYINV